MPPKFTLSRSRHVLQLMGPSSKGAEAIAERYRQLVNLPDAQHIQALRDEYPSKRVVRAERFLCGRPYSGPQPQLGREMCDRETQVEPNDQVVPWVLHFPPQSRIIRRPQPPPPGYLLGPTNVLTRIFALARIDDPATGRSLCLVSKGFYAAVGPVMLYWVRLKQQKQMLGLAHLISIDVVVKWRIHRLTIDTCGLEKALLLEERDWDEAESLGMSHWDSGYWGDPEAGYLDDPESSDESDDSYESGEEMDLDQDVAFFTSPEGQLRGNLTYDSEGELVAGARWPWDVGLEQAWALVNNVTSHILHTLAPALRHLELISKDPQLGIAFPTFPELSVLTIRSTLLPGLRDHPHTLFPALKTLRVLRGSAHVDANHIDLDNLIHHAPSIALLRIPFYENILRDIIKRLAIVPHSLPGQQQRFECVEMIHVGYPIAKPRRIRVSKVLGSSEKE